MERISFFVHDLAINPLGRALPLARAASRQYEVEILGLLIQGRAVYAPYRDSFSYNAIPAAPTWKAISRALPQIAEMASGDIIYVCKPIPTTIAPGFLAAGAPAAEWDDLARELTLASNRVPVGCSPEGLDGVAASRIQAWAKLKQRPVILDVDDDEWECSRSLPDLNVKEFTRLIHPLAMAVDAATVVSSSLQHRYGGEIVYHGPDERVFDPGRDDLTPRLSIRERIVLPPDRMIALFAGTPRPHKGLDVLTRALLDTRCLGWHLALVGDPVAQPYQQIKALLGDRCHLLGFRRHSSLPEILSAVDAVVIPQHQSPFAASQIPAKLLDAMAMAKPIIASRVGDITEVLGDGERGWLVEPGESEALAITLNDISGNSGEARRRGLAARAWHMQNGGIEATQRKLKAVIAAALGR